MLYASCILLKLVQIRWRAETPRGVTRATCVLSSRSVLDAAYR